jgi:hypothetical protein
LLWNWLVGQYAASKSKRPIQDAWLGPVAGQWARKYPNSIEWRYGFIRRISEISQTEIPIQAVAESGALRFLTGVQVIAKDFIGPLIAAMEVRQWPRLRQLALFNADHEAPSLAGLINNSPNLAEIRIMGLDFPSAAFPALRKWRLTAHGLAAFSRTIAASDCPALEVLNIDACCDIDDASKLDLSLLPSLRTLVISGRPPQEILQMLIQSPARCHLEELSLGRESVTDEGAAFLISHASDFAHLRSLRLNGTALSQRVKDALCAALPAVDCKPLSRGRN